MEPLVYKDTNKPDIYLEDVCLVQSEEQKKETQSLRKKENKKLKIYLNQFLESAKDAYVQMSSHQRKEKIKFFVQIDVHTSKARKIGK